MKIRTRLIVSITALLIVSMLSLGYGILFVQRARERDDMERSAKIIENSVRRVALDAMLQKDDLQLVSYVNFLKAQYPALSYARITWLSGGRSRGVSLGESSPAGAVSERSLEVADPSDPARRVGIRLGISDTVIERSIRENQRRLKRIIIQIWLGTSILWFLVAYYLAWSITAPIESLGRVAADIGAGRLGRRLEWRSQDEIGHLVGVFNHMSERLAELDEAKRNFISSVTHEFRSPLGAIESFIGLIQAQAGGPQCREHREYLCRVEANVQRLSRFVNDLLDVAQIEKGRMECVLQPVRLRETAADVCKFFEAKSRAQGLALSNRITDTPLVLADAGRVRQVLVNLIANAFKFTPRGGTVELACEQYREAAQRWLEVSVSDSGRGMEPRDLSRLFQAFSQGRNVAEGVHGAGKGTGLGLYICKSIMDQHGGRIRVQSEPGRGTRVSFTLKVAEREAGSTA
ncbi:MAG: HAMP domain-containing sensor histidine kinase [Elusimicrobia bacterium]|nr:HAMP domain-containing sensor histidine kinase [Elusimicrobiota bacterium]